jgi:hypothetical protein
MGKDVTAGHLVSGQMYEAVYDGTNFVLRPSNFGASEIVWSWLMLPLSAVRQPTRLNSRKRLLVQLLTLSPLPVIRH